MKDFLKKYHNKKIIGDIGVIATSLVLAFGINFFLIDGTSIGGSLKTSILDTQTIENKSDLYIENIGNKILIKNSKDILNVKDISLSLIYNPLEIQISEINSKFGEIVILGEKNTGFDTILINLSLKDINSLEDIIEINTVKLLDKSTQVNMINANFEDGTGEKYNFSTSGITF